MTDHYRELLAPAALPEPGYYSHYKRDPDGEDPFNYDYRILPSIGLYTEEDGPEDRYRAEYRPLYAFAKVYQIGLQIGRIVNDHRPLSMLLETVEVNGVAVPRFKRETDPERIAAMKRRHNEMYPDDLDLS